MDFALLMFFSNLGFLIPTIVFAKKKWFLLSFITFCTCFASSYYHICFSNIQLPPSYYLQYNQTYFNISSNSTGYNSTTLPVWTFYDTLKCGEVSVSFLSFLKMMDYLFANTSALATFLLLIPHTKSYFKIYTDKIIYDSNPNQKEDSYSHGNVSRRKKFYLFFGFIWILVTVSYFQLFVFTVHEIDRTKDIYINITVGLYLLIIYTYEICIYKDYIKYEYTKSTNGRDGLLYVVGGFWVNILKPYYIEKYDTFLFSIAWITGISGIIVWTFIQKINYALYHIVHPIWHLFSFLADTMFALSIKTD